MPRNEGIRISKNNFQSETGFENELKRFSSQQKEAWLNAYTPKNKAMKSPFINDSSSSSSSMRKIKNSRNSTTLVTQLDLQDVPELSLTRPTRPSPMRK